MTNMEISMILEKHKHWLLEDCNNWDNMKADLSGVDLRMANLSGVDLRMAYLSGANLSGAYLSGANLSGANLSGVDLRMANLSGVDLRMANLSGANLSGANLSGVDLRMAVLSGANLKSVCLKDAKYDKEYMERYFPISCPEFGSFIGFKKAQNNIIKLMIPEDAMRCSAFGRKCRCNKAYVLEIENLDGSNSELKEIPSDYDASFRYKIGEMVEIHDFDTDRFNECAPGIHFFITRNEAVFYQ